MADKQITRRLHIYINGKEVERTLSNLRKEHAKAKAQLNRSPIGSKEWEKSNRQVNRLGKELGYAKKQQTQFLETTKTTNKVIDDSAKGLSSFTGHFSNMMRGYATGDLIAIREGFNGVKLGIKGAAKSAWAFAATPIGAIITGLMGIGLAAKVWFDYNAQVVEALKTTNAITGLTDAAADKARINAETLQEVYGTDFEKTLTTAKTLVSQFKISYDEAFATIEDGLKRGQGKNAEYFDSLGEYGTFFKSAGYSAQQFKDIISTGYDLSIYKDKLPDALKEADLSLKEQSKSTKDSLVNAFGASFANDLLKRIKTGKTTTKDALQEIVKESEKANLNQQQFAQLTADVFKGAGEDVGGAKKIFEALTIAIDGTKKPLTESQQLLEDQAKATRDLKTLNSSLFATGDKGWGLIVDKAKLFGTKVLVQILQKGVDVINWFVELNNKSGAFSTVLALIGKAATSSFRVLGILLKNIGTGFSGLGNIIEGVFTLDSDKIAAGFQKTMSVIPNIVKDVVKTVKNDFSDLKNAFEGGVKMKKITLESTTTNDTDPKKTTTKTPVGLTPEQTKAIEDKKKTLEKTENEISDFLKKEYAKRNISHKDGLEKDLALIDDSFQKQIEKAGENEALITEITSQREDAKNEVILQKERELQEELDLLKFEAEELLKLNKFDKSIEDANSNREREIAIIDRAQFIANRELEIEKQKELAKVDAVEGAEKIKDLIRKKYAIKEQAVNKSFTKSKKALKGDEVKWTKLTEDQKLGTIKGALSNASDAFNKGSAAWKATKIAETTITTYQSAVSSYNSLAGIPIIGVGLGITAAALAVKTGLKQISAIKNTKSEKMPASFAAGGFTDGLGTGYRDETGEEVANAKLHTGEYVIPRFVRAMPEVPAIIQWLDEKRTNKLRGYATGGSATKERDITETLDSNENLSIDNNEENSALSLQIERLNNRLDHGIMAYTVRDYEAFLIQKEEDEQFEQILSNTKK